MALAPRRMVVFGVLATLVLLLTTVHYLAIPKYSLSKGKIGELAIKAGDQVQALLHPGQNSNNTAKHESSNDEIPKATKESEKGNGEIGKFLHVRPSRPASNDARVEGCEYPMVIHVTPDAHCTGALGLYGSIVRNVLLQPEHLANKTCVHFTFVDPKLETIEEMYQWPKRDNPYTHIADCAALDNSPELNAVVPVRWQALAPIEKPAIMEAGLETWLAALNKVHSWGFDLYPRILILDADSIIITDVHLIFDETPMSYTISGAPDQFANCNDRAHLNGGMILLRPSRYFHISATELLYDPGASCASGKWQQSEQELLNCICGYNNAFALSPEFTCNIMPMYNSVWPKNYGCSNVNIVPLRSIHFTAAPKPWTIKEELLDVRFDTLFWRCVRDATRGSDLEGLKICDVPGLEVTRKVTMGGHF